jgi:rod shape-determining protein MreB
VAQAIQDCLGTIVQTVRAVLEKTPPELASDVIDRGIVLTGGGALLRHMDELLTQETGVPCYVADNPLECVAIGAGIALDHLDVIKRSLPTEEENLVGLFPGPEMR